MWWAIEAGRVVLPEPGADATCPECGGAVIPKCGELVAWHWAHRANHPPCEQTDPWKETSGWHVAWQHYCADAGGWMEVPMTNGTEAHRADVVAPDGRVIEFQHSHLEPAQIRAREAFYRDVIWVYDAARWTRRLHLLKGQTWKRTLRFIWHQPVVSLATHRRELWWDVGENELWRCSVWTYETGDGRRLAFVQLHQALTRDQWLARFIVNATAKRRFPHQPPWVTDAIERFARHGLPLVDPDVAAVEAAGSDALDPRAEAMTRDDGWADACANPPDLTQPTGWTCQGCGRTVTTFHGQGPRWDQDLGRYVGPDDAVCLDCFRAQANRDAEAAPA
jgi:hypothetical protein